MLTNLFGGLGAGGFGDGGAALSCMLVDLPCAACMSGSAMQTIMPFVQVCRLAAQMRVIFQRCNIGTQWSNIIFCMPLAIANDLQAAAGSCTQGRAMASGRCAPLHKCALDYCPVTCRTCSSPCQTLQGSLASLFAGLVVLLHQMGLLSLIPLCTSRNVGSCRLQTTQGSSLKLKRLMPS